MHKSSTSQNSPKQICLWILIWEDNRTIGDWLFHWRKHYYILWTVWTGLLWCFYQLFRISFWRHPFTAEDPLVSKCNLMKWDSQWNDSLDHCESSMSCRIHLQIESGGCSGASQDSSASHRISWCGSPAAVSQPRLKTFESTQTNRQ